jgi:hypothetical protein
MNEWINQIGNWNPQLLREWRGRLKLQTLLATFLLSFSVQLLLFLAAHEESADLSFAVNWNEIWVPLSWIFPYILFTVGGYFIVSDLTQEEKRGTLNFIRLSPRPAQEILLGKFLGVPILVYLAIGSALPLHFFSGVLSGIPVWELLSYYGILAASTLCCYSAALWMGMQGTSLPGFASRPASNAISFAALAFTVFSPLFMFGNCLITWYSFQLLDVLHSDWGNEVFWYGLLINGNSWLAHAFVLLNIAIVTCLFWLVIIRRFQQPRSTPLSKLHSYGILTYFELITLGWVLPQHDEAYILQIVLTSFVLVVLMFAIAPQRSALLDWVSSSSQGWQSLLLSDKSPAIAAIALHLGIANAILLPMILASEGRDVYPGVWLVIIAVTNALLLYGTFIQTVFASQLRFPLMWAAGALGAWWILPPIFLILLGLTPDQIPVSAIAWTFLGFPWELLIDKSSESIVLHSIGILGQWIFLGYLLIYLQRMLGRLKAESKQFS